MTNQEAPNSTRNVRFLGAGVGIGLGLWIGVEIAQSGIPAVWAALAIPGLTLFLGGFGIPWATSIANRIWKGTSGFRRIALHTLAVFPPLLLLFSMGAGYIPWRLSRSHGVTQGKIVEVHPENHYSFVYEYSTGHGTYRRFGRCQKICDESLISKPVTVYYLESAPNVSTVEEPKLDLFELLLVQGFFAMALTLMLGVGFVVNCTDGVRRSELSNE